MPILVVAMLGTCCGQGWGQQQTIGSADTVEACGFYFLDDGGALQPASEAADLTTTYCPATPGDPLTFSFSTFQLSAGDTLFLWRGPEALGAPDGAYSGTSLVGVDVGNGAGGDNPTGCMTWRFVSVSAGPSNWAALATCTAPCDRPVASATIDNAGPPAAGPVEACLGEAIAFDATASSWPSGSGAALWSWDFGDGTAGDLGPTPEHAFDTPGVYPVRLTLTDSSGCASVNDLGLTVHVAAPIQIDLPDIGPTVCAGGAAVLQLGPGAVTTTPVASLPNASFGAGIMIPDSVGQAFTSEITFSGFPYGQTVDGMDDLVGITLNLEHSFILDLAISLECPDGGTMVLQGWPGGFGGCVNAGLPVTGDDPPQPGTGFDYTWSPAADDDWQTVAVGLLPTPTSGCASTTPSLPPGNYAATGDWTPLLGCPVNGTWTLRIVDTQAGDNGFLFGWSMDFAEDITPEQTVFEAPVALDCSGLSWAPLSPWGFNEAPLPDCTGIVVEPTTAGTFGYVLTATDAFGCTADSTITITAEAGLDFILSSDPLDPTAGIPQSLCEGEPLLLQAWPVGASLPGTTHGWVVDGVSTGPSGLTLIDAAPAVGPHVITFQATSVAVPPTPGLCHFEWTDTLEVFALPSVDMTVEDRCTDVPVEADVSVDPQELEWSWTLTSGAGDTLSTVNWSTPVFGYLAAGQYGLSVTVTDGQGCWDMATDGFTVMQAPDAGFSLDAVCAGEPLPFTLDDPVGYADPSTAATWTLVGGGELADEGGHLGTAATWGGGFPQVTLTLVTDHPEGTCTTTHSEFAMVHSLPVIALYGPEEACEGDDGQWWGGASIPFPDIVTSTTWTVTGDTSLVLPGSPVLALDSPDLGSYAITYSALSDQGCAADQVLPFVVQPKPEADFALPAVVCRDEVVPMTWSGPTDAIGTWTMDGDALEVAGGWYDAGLTAMPGSITVVHTVVQGSCSDTAVALLEVAPLPIAVLEGPDAVCAGTPVAWNDLSFNPTSEALTTVWTPAPGTPGPTYGPDLADLGTPDPGSYGMALMVTTAAGCADSTAAVLFVGAAPDAGFSLEEVCAGTAIPLTLDDPEGYAAAEAQWTWDGAPFDLTATDVLPAGVAAEAGTSTIGLTLSRVHPEITCTSQHAAVVEVHAQPAAAIAAPDDFCAGPDALFSDATTIEGGTAVSIAWSLDDGAGLSLSGSASDLLLPAPAPGIYQVFLSATTDAGCTSEASDTLEVLTAADAGFNLPAMVCQGGSVAVEWTGAATDPGIWTWEGNPIGWEGGSFGGALTAEPGLVTVVHIVEVGPCSDTASAVLDVAPLPVVGLSGPMAICEGTAAIWSDDSVNPTADPLTYTWTPTTGNAPPASSGAFLDFGLPAPGTYGIRLTVATAAGCADSLWAELLVAPTPDAGFAAEEVCAGTPIPLAFDDPDGYAEADAEWLWAGSPLDVGGMGAPDFLPDEVSAAAGTQDLALILTLDHPAITCAAQYFTTTEVHAQPAAAIAAPDDFCAGPDAAFADATAVDAGIGLNLDWTLDDGSGALSWGADPVMLLTAPEAGVYAVSLTASTAAGCTSTALDTVAVYDAPDATFSLPDVVCQGQAVAVPTVGTPGVQSWTVDGVPLTGQDGWFEAALTDAWGAHTVGVTVVLGSGAEQCQDQHEVPLLVEALPLVDFSGFLAACEGEVVQWQEQCSHPQGLPLTLGWEHDGAGSASDGGATLDLGPNPPGQFAVTLTATGPAGCTSMLQSSVEVHPAPTADFTLTEACSGTPIGWAPQGAGFFGTPSWTWQGTPLGVTGDALPAEVSAAPGPQTVSLTLVSSYDTGIACSSTESVTTQVHPTPTAALSGPADVCVGDTALFEGQGANALDADMTYGWTWSGSAGGSATGSALALSDLPAGSLEVQLDVTAEGGCSASAQGILDVVAVPQAAFFLPPEACAGDPVQLGVDPATVPLDTLWTLDGEAVAWSGSGIPVGLTDAPGVHGVGLAVTLSSGTVSCVSTAVDSLIVHAVPEVDWDLVPEVCDGQPLTWNSNAWISSGVPLTTTWSVEAGGSISAATGPAFVMVDPQPGDHAAILTVEGAGGCSATLEGAWTVHPTPQAAFTADDVCQGTPIPVAPNDPDGFAGSLVQWTWNGNPSNVVGGGLDALASANPGPQMVGVTVTTPFASGFSCSDVHDVVVEVWANPTAALDLAEGVCAGTSVLVEDLSTGPSGIGLGVSWTLDGDPAPVGGVPLDFGPLPVGMHEVGLVVMTDQGCADAASGTVQVHAVPDAAFTVEDVCEGAPAEWTPIDPEGWWGSPQWSWNGNPIVPEGGTLPDSVTVSAGPQILEVMLTGLHPDGTTCTSGATAVLEVHARPELTWNVQPGWCLGTPAAFAADAGAVEAVLDWALVGNQGTTGFAGTVADLGMLPAGTYTLMLSATTAEGCVDSLGATVKVHPNPEVDFSLGAVCAGLPIPVSWPGSSQGPDDGTEAQWTWGGNPIQVQGDVLPDVVSAEPGLQWLQLTAAQAHPTGALCEASAIQSVEVHPLPVAAVAGDTLWCAGEDVIVHAATATGGGAVTCAWSSPLGPAEGPAWSVPPGLTGLIPATLVVTSEGGCSDEVGFQVRIDPLPEVVLSDTLIMDCAPFDAEIGAAATGHAGLVLSTEWSWPGGGSSGQVWTAEVGVGPVPLTVTVTTGDAGLMCSGSAQAMVVGLEVPEADFAMFPEVPTVHQGTVDLWSNGGGPVAEYLWTIDGEVVGHSAEGQYTFAPHFGDTYTVCLETVSPFGCADVTCREVEVIGDVQVYVPSAFTPDNDGINDAFLPSVAPLDQVEDYRLEVYNRWGELVFATEDPEEAWWGASASGTHFAGNEVYNWVITLDTEPGLPQRLMGQVTAIR